MTDPIHPGSPFTTSYRADGQPASVAAPNGNSTAFGYDAAGQPTTKTTSGTGGASRAAYTWTQNRAGNRLTENSVITGDTTNGTTDYGYDALGRLITFTPVGISSQATTWQAVPNRATLQVGSGTTVTTTFDAANRPTSDSAGGSYISDDDGRLTARPGQTLTYDSLGRLLTVTVSGVTTTYTYDPLDRLRTVTRSGAVQRFRYVGRTTNAAQVVDGSGTVIRTIANDWAGTRLLDWTGSGSNQRFYGTNGHHDVTWTADGTGAVTATLRYDPWGVLRASSGASLPDFRFQGSWYDTSTDLSWVVTRWYAPALGRFLSEDTLLGEPGNPGSHHLYAYGAGEPVARWDPDGRAYWQGRASPTSRLWRLRNPMHVRGRIGLSLFIRAKSLANAGFQTLGDNRGFRGTPVDCVDARGCIKVDFERGEVKARANPTCIATWPISFGWKCFNQFGWHERRDACNHDRCNTMEVSEMGGVAGTDYTLRIEYSMTQSALQPVRPDLTVDGRILIKVKRGQRWMSITYHGDGFPSEEMYYATSRGAVTRILRHDEGAWFDMQGWWDGGLGNYRTGKAVLTS